MASERLLIGEPIYIVGHIKPDVDAIVSAYSYQVYRHAKGDFNYLAVRCDEPNHLTEWLFKSTGFEMPRLVKTIKGRKVVLVDHTDPDQRAKGWEEADIIEVFDHHKLKLETSAPPKITVKPYGSTTTIVADKLFNIGFTITPEFAQLMLSAIIDDTLALRSPITTYVDKIVAGKLAALTGLGDIDAYARKMFNKKDIWYKLGPAKLVGTDTKRYELGDVKVGISQVETLDNSKLIKKIPEIHKYLKKLIEKEGLDLFVVMLTDVIENEALIVAEGKNAPDLEKIFGKQFKDGAMKIEGMMSRKKQMVPPLTKFYTKNKKQ